MSTDHRHLYVLRCADGSLSIGISDDVAATVARVNKGEETTVKAPVFLVHTEEYMNERDAKKRAAVISGMETQQQERLVSTHGLASVEFAMAR